MTKQIFLPSDGPTGTPSLRTLGTGALQAGAGNDSRFSDARTPTDHASTHDVGGSDVLKDLTRLAAGPAMHGYTPWTFDPFFNGNSGTAPSAGFVYLAKILTAQAFTVNNIDFFIGQAGTGVTALANCFVGIYDSGGTRRFVSADQSSAWATSGPKSIGSVAYTVTANDFLYCALLIGTQSTTNCKFACAVPSFNPALMGLIAATARAGTNTSGNTSLPGSLTLSSTTSLGQLFLFALK